MEQAFRTVSSMRCYSEHQKAYKIGRLQAMYPASGSFEQDTHRVSAEVSVVDGQFATEPMTVVKQAEQQVSEEDLHYFFEQAISVRFNRVSESLSGARMWSIQRSETWQHSIIQVCLALLLILSGFDLMGLLVLYLR